MLYRRYLIGLIALFATGFAGAAAGKAAPPALKVMTFNVRLPLASDGPNSWEHRRALAVRTIARAAPDIIGTQELYREQGDHIVARLPHYAWTGIDRRGGHTDEHMGLFYRRDRLRVLSSGNFWLSDTPDVPGSITWGHPYPRMVTWAQFVTRTGGHRFFAFDTHFPYRAGDGAARVKAAALLIAKIRAIAGDAPVVITGDFNTTPDTDVHALLVTRFADARDGPAARLGPAETFHDFTGKADRRIDWILTYKFTTRRVETLTDHQGALWPSDHFPVVATLQWPSAHGTRVAPRKHLSRVR